MAANVLSTLNGALDRVMAADERVVVMGEDLLDPYGGAFKVTKGLSTKYPTRVLTSPISEAGLVGLATGMAIRGLLPVVEIMFGDFLALAADQLLNHATKYAWMYDGKVEVPLVVRTPMGGRRGYGPTHSQSIEKHFLGMAGLTVLAVHPFSDPGALLEHAITGVREPVLFVENKLMYSRGVRLPDGDGRVGDLSAKVDGGPTPTTTLSFEESFASADVTIVAYGGMAELAVDAAEALLLDEEIYAEVVLPTSLSPLDTGPILDSLRRSGRLLVAEEGHPEAGFGAEVIRRVTTEGFEHLRAAPVSVASLPVPIANTKTLETAILPQREDLIGAVKRMMQNRSGERR